MKRAFEIFIGLVVFVLALLVLVIGKSITSNLDNELSIFATYILTFGFVAALLTLSWKSIMAKSGNTISYHNNDVSDDTYSVENINDTRYSTNKLSPSVAKDIEEHTESSSRESKDNMSIDDEILYEYVLLNEIEEDNKVKSTWAKALAHTDGNVTKAESLYMQNRVKTITDQMTTLKIAYNEMSKKDLFDNIKNDFKNIIAEQRKLEKEVKMIEEAKKIEEEKKREELKIQEIKNDDAFFYSMLGVVTIIITVFIFIS